MINMGFGVIMALTVVLLGLYSIAFSRSAANWALSLDNNLAQPDLHEKIYRAGFTVVGASFIAFGLLTVLLIA